MKNFSINEDSGELKVFTDTGYYSVKPYGEGIAVMLYDKNNVDGLAEDENGLLGVDVAVIENYEGTHQAMLWEDSNDESYTKKITFNIRQENKK